MVAICEQSQLAIGLSELLVEDGRGGGNNYIEDELEARRREVMTLRIERMMFQLPI